MVLPNDQSGGLARWRYLIAGDKTPTPLANSMFSPWFESTDFDDGVKEIYNVSDDSHKGGL